MVRTAPMEKLGAMRTPTPGNWSSQPFSCARRSSVQPVVPTTAWMPCRTQKSRLPITEAGVVSSTTTWASASTRVSSLSPLPRAATSSMSSAASTARTASDPMRPLAPRTATRSLLMFVASLREGSGDGVVQPGRLLVLERADDRQGGPSSQDVAGDGADVVRGDRGYPGEHVVDRHLLAPAQLALADTVHQRAGVLQAEDGGAPQLADGAFDLLVGQTVLGDLVELVAADLQHVVHLGGPAARVHAEQSAVGEAGGVRVHAVGQAALLADLLEQAGGHAAAEGGVEHAERPAAVVGAGQAGHAEDDVGLLGPAVEEFDPAGGAQGALSAARGDRCGRGVLERAGLFEGGPDLADDRGVVDVAGAGDDQVGGVVVLAVEAADAVGGERVDRVDGAEDGAAEGVVAEHGVREQVVHA